MKNSDQPAYPILDPNSSYYREGLTKREYFAGLAMQGILASGIPWKHKMTTKEIAVECTHVADALLKQLEQ